MLLLGNSFFNTAMLGASGEIPTITQVRTEDRGDTLNSNSFTFQGVFGFGSGATIPKGTFIVVVLVAQPTDNSTIGTWTGLVDAAGNTYTEAVEGTQENNKSFSAIYYSKITNDLPHGTLFTATSSLTNGTTSYRDGKIFRTFILTGVNDLDNVQAKALTSRDNHFASAVTSRGKGIAIFSLSTNTNREFFSLTNDFINQSGSTNPCSVCVTKVLNEDAGTTVGSTVQFSNIGGSSVRSCKTASLFATFK